MRGVAACGHRGISGLQAQITIRIRFPNDAMHYAPSGSRGLGLGTSHNDLQRPDAPEYLERANERNTLLCQTESTVALENLEEIAWVPSVARVARAAKAHGQFAGIQPGSVQQAGEWMELGYNAISYSTDIGIYGSALAEEIRQVRDIASRSAGT